MSTAEEIASWPPEQIYTYLRDSLRLRIQDTERLIARTNELTEALSARPRGKEEYAKN